MYIFKFAATAIAFLNACQLLFNILMAGFALT